MTALAAFENLDLERIVSALGASVVLSGWAVVLLHWMLDELISVRVGLLSILGVVPLLYLAIYPPHPSVQYAVLLIVATSAVFIPQAIKYWDSRENERIDLRPLERSYAALAAKPDNTQAVFDIATWLAENGFTANAIAIATPAANSLSPERDPISNKSVKDLYITELKRLEDWKKQPHGTAVNFKCPQCKQSNAPPLLFCKKCGAPFVQLIAQRSLGTGADLGRIAFGFTTTAAILGMGSAYALTHPGQTVPGFTVILLCGSLVLVWTFRSRKPLR
ncbi:MAG: hypothetical protein U0R49_08995 [Fimbriimonadales bacterium]